MFVNIVVQSMIQLSPIFTCMNDDRTQRVNVHVCHTLKGNRVKVYITVLKGYRTRRVNVHVCHTLKGNRVKVYITVLKGYRTRRVNGSTSSEDRRVKNSTRNSRESRGLYV